MHRVGKKEHDMIIDGAERNDMKQQGIFNSQFSILNSQFPRIGIFGGSFNPIHTGHISLARQLLSLAQLDEIWFVVSPLNPFKQASSDLLADDLRLQIARTALAAEPRLKASDYEFHLPKPSYTYSTLARLRTDYPQHEFVLIIGADNWLSFDRWARPDDILSHHRIAVYPRPGYTVDESSLPQQVRLYPTPLYPVSSTEIRQRVRQGLPVRSLVPSAIIPIVEQYYR